MEYLTGCYRRQTAGNGFLLLQQYRCRQTVVCFACIGEDARSGMREKMEMWAQHAEWHNSVRRTRAWLAHAERELSELSEGCGKYQILLGIGAEILALGIGYRACLLNTDFGRGRLSVLPNCFYAVLEPGAGLLLATDGFFGRHGMKMTGEALKTGELRTEEQILKRLEELAGERENGEEQMAVLLIGR